ncbi:MAG: EAL domain-containing protein [Plesiomonas shigelloides]
MGKPHQFLPFLIQKANNTTALIWSHYHVLDSIIAFSKESHMDVIAEGVETKTQLTYLLARGIHLIQGFIYAKPLSFEHLKVWLTEPRRH